MKAISIFIGCWLGLLLCSAEAQVVEDPLLDYYQAIKAGDTLGDDEPHYSPQTRIYYFKADFTGDGCKSIFITDDQSRQGPHGLYGWFVYYPLTSGGYQKAEKGISMYIMGPDYIGYVAQIKQYGIVMGSKNTVCVFYLNKNTIDLKYIDEKPGHADALDYPKYFHDHRPNYDISTYTLAQLAQKFAK